MAARKNDLPPVLKPIQPFLVIAKQFASRDPVVNYYATMYAVQVGLDYKDDPGAKVYLGSLMDKLQKLKQGLAGIEAITNDDIAQSHIEEVAFKLFDHADTKDRNAEFDKTMIKSFFTASQLFTMLKQFGELSDEIEMKMKYAKWKAVEIDRCLKNNITPTPGPPGGFTDDEPVESEPSAAWGTSSSGGGEIGFKFTDNVEKPVPKPRQNVASQPNIEEPPLPSVPSSQVSLGPAEIAKAQKLCKFASSALDYDDTIGAINYLEDALKLLKTGQ